MAGDGSIVSPAVFDAATNTVSCEFAGLNETSKIRVGAGQFYNPQDIPVTITQNYVDSPCFATEIEDGHISVVPALSTNSGLMVMYSDALESCAGTAPLLEIAYSITE